MKEVDLGRVAEDQIVARAATLRPLAEVDEAGAESETETREVIFEPGDRIVVMGERQDMVLAYRNYGQPPHYGLPPYVFRKADLRRVLVQE